MVSSSDYIPIHDNWNDFNWQQAVGLQVRCIVAKSTGVRTRPFVLGICTL